MIRHTAPIRRTRQILLTHPVGSLWVGLGWPMTHLEMPAWRAFGAGEPSGAGRRYFFMGHGLGVSWDLVSSLLAAYSSLFRPRSWAGWVGPLGGWARPFVNG